MIELEADPRMRDLVQEQRLTGDVEKRFLTKHRLGHPGERGEFVDHPPEVADLADDRLGQTRKRRIVRVDLAAVAALEALRRELDGGERVLDLVRDPSGDVRPGGAALIEQLLRDVVEGQDGAGVGARDPHRERPRFAPTGDLHDRLAFPADDKVEELGSDGAERSADQSVRPGPEQRGRGSVGQADRAIARRGDDAGRNPRHHRFDQRPSALDGLIGGDERVGLCTEALGHAIERIGEHADLVGRSRDRDARGEIAACDPVGRGDQFADRTGEPVGDAQRDPCRQADDQQGDGEECKVELYLKVAGACLQTVVGSQLLRGGKALLVQEVDVVRRGDVEEQIARPVYRRHHPQYGGVVIGVAFLVAQHVQHAPGDALPERGRLRHLIAIQRFHRLSVHDLE